MAHETGTASSETDLLQKLDTFLTGNAQLTVTGEQWQRIYDHTTQAGDSVETSRAVVWQAPGASGGDKIYIGAYTHGVTASNTYNLCFCGGSMFSAAGVVYDDMHSGFINISKDVVLFADRRSFRYWFFASGRRVIVVTGVNTIYSSAYCGFMLPVVNPSEYPYPLVIAGSASNTGLRYSDTTDAHSSIVDPRQKNFWLLYPDQGWRDIYGRNYSYSTTGADKRYLTPNGATRYKSGILQTLTALQASPGSHCPLFPVEVRSLEESGVNFLGALDGVFWLPGVGRASEDTISSADGHQYVVFQNGFRITPCDYFAVEVS
ncbi:hypothetical protein [Citrobacter braakii]|uniref:Uncharacterized protein n=1 Tax=Citrobacter braakii TaxID=57706 RepID=A0A1V8NVX8_CITBR|nr:hypothetical protein [Citrobacter braakii]OQM40575.1 hypothetical protein BZK42_18620 [Citrobacter braakii]QXC18216.1 hypothetical protein I6L51_09190 [Citrobacter braakii]